MDTFLEQSRTFMRSVTESYDLINTARAGFDLLSEQVKKVVKAGANDNVLEALYAMPNGATGQNLRAHALKSEEDKSRELAEMWLLVIFSRYESWAESLEFDYGIAGSKRGCQFPEPSFHAPGYDEAFSILQVDPLMESIYKESIEIHKFWLPSISEIKSALNIYRYYKEIRNSLAHSDGKANQRLVDSSFTALQSLNSLNLRHPLKLSTVSNYSTGQPISITLPLARDVIDLLHRLVFTTDAKILISTLGRDEFLRRWTQNYGVEPLVVQNKMENRSPWYASRVSENLKMPHPTDPLEKQKKWPLNSRRAFWEYATNNSLIKLQR